MLVGFAAFSSECGTAWAQHAISELADGTIAGSNDCNVLPQSGIYLPSKILPCVRIDNDGEGV
jgi:hypothetical protein